MLEVDIKKEEANYSKILTNWTAYLSIVDKNGPQKQKKEEKTKYRYY